MQPSVAANFRRLEKSREVLFEKVSGLSGEQLSFKASEDSWSITQVLNHLLKAETGTLGYMRKKNQADSLDKLSISASLKSALLVKGLLLPVRFRAPGPVSQPPNTGNLADIRNDWDQQHQQLQAFLSELPADRTGKMIFRHPITGPMNIKQTLGFLNNHIRHHLRQINRIIKSADFPQQ